MLVKIFEKNLIDDRSQFYTLHFNLKRSGAPKSFKIECVTGELCYKCCALQNASVALLVKG